MSKDKKKRTTKKQVEYLKYSVGIDISKDKFDVNISVIDISQYVKVIASRSFNNTESGYKLYIEWIQRKCKLGLPIVHTMEATGIYYEKLAWFLHRTDEHLSVVLPNKAKKYLQSLGLKSKNDKIDAKGLARMGAEQKLERWKAPGENIVRLRNITRHREQLTITKTQISNQLHALKYGEYVDEKLIEQQESIIAILETQIEETLDMIQEVIDNDSVLKEKVEKITTIKGLGIVSVATVIAETNEFVYFTNQRQLVSYCGYDVVENQSGKHVGKTKISKRGNAHIRTEKSGKLFVII
jgi:transposase